MTPFAAEISRNLSRFMRNKIRFNDSMKESDICKTITDYFVELYPNRVYRDELTLYVVNLKNEYDAENEEIVPIFLSTNIIHQELKSFEIQGKNKSKVLEILHKDQHITKESNLAIISIQTEVTTKSDPIARRAFLDKMIELQSIISKYKNINDGFVCFLTNEEALWSKDKQVKSEQELDVMRDIAFQELTLLPEIQYQDKPLGSFQAVWLPTRNRRYNFCLGMIDKSLKYREYNCEIKKCKEASNFILSSAQLVETEVPIDKSSLSVELRFAEMLKIERFVKNTKGDNWLWEWESPFLNDYSRLMMSPAIRRMKDKTQVFTFESSDFHRGRLTHSLEVANVARLIGLGVEYTLNKGIEVTNPNGEKKPLIIPNVKDLHISQILEVAGLIHDIGNPPFGHFGERTIQEFFRNTSQMSPEVRKQFEDLEPQQKADFENFDGNVQGFRILRHLGLSTDCSSFNLNKAIVSTLIKYPYSSVDGNKKEDIDCRRHKFGYFQKEESAYNQIQETLLLDKGQRHPLAYLLEAADDICYMGSDIEDGWKLAYINAKVITRTFIDSLSDKEQKAVFGDEWRDLYDRIGHSDKVLAANGIQSLRIRMQRYMVTEVVKWFCQNIERIVTNQLKDDEHELIKNIPTVKKIHDIWKSLVQNCYNQIHGSQIQGGQILTALLKCFTETIFCGNLITYKEKKTASPAIKGNIYIMKFNTDTKSGMIYETISDNFRYELSPAGQFVPQDAYDKFLLVTDYISGMSDSFATCRYEDLMIK